MNKLETILKLQELLSVAMANDNTYFVNSLTKIIESLREEFNLSDEYDRQIRQSLAIDETLELLNNLTNN